MLKQFFSAFRSNMFLLWRHWKSTPLTWLDGFPRKGGTTIPRFSPKAKQGLVSVTYQTGGLCTGNRE